MFAWYGSTQSVDPQRPAGFTKRHSYSAKIDVIRSSRAHEVSVCTISLLSDRDDRNLTQFSPRARKFTRCATATAVGPYSSSDLIGSYNNDTSRLPSSNNIIKNGTNVSQRTPNYELERRPSSLSKEHRKNAPLNSKGYDTDRERDIHDRHKDNTHGLTNSHRANYFKPLGLRNNYLSGQTPSSGHINPVTPTPTIIRTPPQQQQQQQQQPLQSRDPDDLVAMGTNWNPNNGGVVRSNGGRPNSQSNSLVYQMSQSNSVSTQASSTSSRRLTSKAINTATQGRIREQEPKYPDPTAGAPPSLQQRISEIAALEQDTIRWEKSRKVKKKPTKDF